MNILHLQFDTEIRTLYQVEAMNNIEDVSLFLAYAGSSYQDRFGFDEDFFLKNYSLPYVNLKELIFNKKSSNYITLVAKLRKIINDEDIDIIHVHKRSDMQCLAALETDVPVLIDSHDMISVMEDSLFGTQGPHIFRAPIIGKIFGKYFYKKLLKTEEYCLKNADFILAVSYIMKDKIMMDYNIDSSKIHVLPNTIPLKYCASKYKNNYHENLNIIWASSFFLNKNSRSHRNIIPLIEIIKEIRDINVDLYGWTEGFDKKKLELFFSKYPNIHYKGLLNPQQYLKVLSMYDIGIIFNNPKYDVQIGEMSLPKKLFEYAANGLPILAYGSKQIQMIVNEYQIGSIFSEISLNAVDKAISDIKNNYKKYSKNALSLIKNKYNWDKQSEELRDIYINIINHVRR